MHVHLVTPALLSRLTLVFILVVLAKLSTFTLVCHTFTLLIFTPGSCATSTNRSVNVCEGQTEIAYKVRNMCEYVFTYILNISKSLRAGVGKMISSKGHFL